MARFHQFTVKIPNDLIQNAALSFNARRMGAVLYSRRNALGACKKSLVTLASSAQCSVATARKALEELESAGYIRKERTYTYNDRLGRMVYGETIYHCDLSFRTGYTLLSRDLFQKDLSASAFCVAMYLRQQAGNGSRAFPSLSRICAIVGISMATVCKAIRLLGSLSVLLTQHCLKINHSFSNNSYFLLRPSQLGSCDSHGMCDRQSVHRLDRCFSHEPSIRPLSRINKPLLLSEVL